MGLSLKPWEELISCCIGAGALAPMVQSKNIGDSRLVTAAPFLKCTLNDLRRVWLLVESAYIAQAAAVAAALEREPNRGRTLLKIDVFIGGVCCLAGRLRLG